MRHMSPSTLFACLLFSAALVLSSSQAQQAKLESETADSPFERAVARTLASMKPHQKALVRGTAKDSLSLLLPEWGSDIQELLGLNPTNTRLAAELCSMACTVEEATLRVMDAAQDVLRRSN